jgi:hypothetical protein
LPRRVGCTSRSRATTQRWRASWQFAARLQQPRPPPSSAEERQWFERIAELMGGAKKSDDDEAMLKKVKPLLQDDREVPLELYEAVKRVVDARVEKLAIKSVLPLVCVLEELDRACASLDGRCARNSVRACVFGAMYEHLLAAHAQLPTDLTSETALETALLWLGVVRQCEFFGRVPSLEPDPAVVAVERAVLERLRSDKALMRQVRADAGARAEASECRSCCWRRPSLRRRRRRCWTARSRTSASR